MSRRQYNTKINNLHTIINGDSDKRTRLRQVMGYKSERKIHKKQLMKKYAKMRLAHNKNLKKRFKELKKKNKKLTWKKFSRANSFDHMIIDRALEEWDIIFDS